MLQRIIIYVHTKQTGW